MPLEIIGDETPKKPKKARKSRAKEPEEDVQVGSVATGETEVLGGPVITPVPEEDTLGFPVRDKTTLIVIHCSATPREMDIGFEEINDWHKDRGWGNDKMSCGYHRIIRRDGTVEHGRPIQTVGAHVLGHNSVSVGVCLVGGFDDLGLPQRNFTSPQLYAVRDLVNELKVLYPDAEVLGHRDLSPDVDGDGVISEWEWMKDCPTFDVRSLLPKINPTPC